MKFKMLAAATMIAALSGQAFAHAHLQSSEPAAQTAVATPTTVTMTFSEPLVIKMSSAMIMTPAGQMIDTDAPKLGDDGKTMIVPLKAPLAAGQYDVSWQILSTDGHKTSGQFAFSVK